jgi:hypothetical protein
LGLLLTPPLAIVWWLVDYCVRARVTGQLVLVRAGRPTARPGTGRRRYQLVVDPGDGRPSRVWLARTLPPDCAEGTVVTLSARRLSGRIRTLAAIRAARPLGPS